MTFTCPICNGQTLQSYNNRKNAQCTNCHSLERTRLLYLALKRRERIGPKTRIMHIAPEKVLSNLFIKLVGDNYFACDIEPQRYRFVECAKVDLCNDIKNFPPNIFDLIIHNHVLEHLPCNLNSVLPNLNRLLTEDGAMYFSIPFRTGQFQENFKEALTNDERKKRFGQHDHMRIFGTSDFYTCLNGVFSKVELPQFSVSDIESVGVEPSTMQRENGHTVFRWKKQSSQLIKLSRDNC